MSKSSSYVYHASVESSSIRAELKGSKERSGLHSTLPSVLNKAPAERTGT